MICFNYCIFVDLVKNQDTFRIYNVHLQSIRLKQEDYSLFKDGAASIEKKSMVRLLIEKLRIAYPKRAEQARAVIDHVQTSPYPTIVCGDFNDTPMSYAYNQFDKLLIDAFRESGFGIGTTYIGKVPAGRIDYIFHSKKIHSANFKVQKDVFSDHRSVYCEIWKEPKIETTTN
jgi:endonuclease/exonuclease/phosphatase family metal-dependent hydrolase